MLMQYSLHLICSDFISNFTTKRIIDVSSEWRTFANTDKESKDMCRVGAAEVIGTIS